MPTCVPFGAFPPRSDAARADVALDSISAAALLGGNAPNGTHVGTTIMSQPLKDPTKFGNDRREVVGIFWSLSFLDRIVRDYPPCNSARVCTVDNCGKFTACLRAPTNWVAPGVWPKSDPGGIAENPTGAASANYLT